MDEKSWEKIHKEVGLIMGKLEPLKALSSLDDIQREIAGVEGMLTGIERELDETNKLLKEIIQKL